MTLLKLEVGNHEVWSAQPPAGLKSHGPMTGARPGDSQHSGHSEREGEQKCKLGQ